LDILMTLRDELAALTAPCREVDAEIAKAFGVPNAHFTASLDDTAELVEREMFDAEVGLEGQWLGRPGWVGWINRSQPDPKVNGRGKHNLPAVALLLALVDAKGIE
jgi:hypothetical protein